MPFSYIPPLSYGTCIFCWEESWSPWAAVILVILHTGLFYQVPLNHIQYPPSHLFIASSKAETICSPTLNSHSIYSLICKGKFKSSPVGVHAIVDTIKPIIKIANIVCLVFLTFPFIISSSYQMILTTTDNSKVFSNFNFNILIKSNLYYFIFHILKK